MHSIRNAFLITTVLCTCFSGAAMADITFEFWDTVSEEAHARCELIPFLGSAQLSAEDQNPSGTGPMDLTAFAEIGDEMIWDESSAQAYSMVNGTYFVDGFGDTYLEVTTEGYAYADSRDPNTASIEAESSGYFLTAIYVPIGETYICTAEFFEWDYAESGPGTDFDINSWHLTMSGTPTGFYTGNGSLYEGASVTLTGQTEPYLFYGGFDFSVEDTSVDGQPSEIWSEQEISLMFTLIPEPATMSILAISLPIIIRRRR